MELSVKKTDYRFSSNNNDYLPEIYECENCGDFCDYEHIYDFNGIGLCSRCWDNEAKNEDYSDYQYEDINGGIE